MFKKDTVFIFGAGASKPFGYPLKNELINNIINNIGDKILLPLSSENKDRAYLIEDVKKHFESINLNNFNELPKQPSTSYYTPDTPTYVVDGKHYIEASLHEIKEFNDLKQALVNFTPISIDTFLRDNESHNLAGIIMIIYSLMKCETKPLKSSDPKGNWFSQLFNDILSDCESPEIILDNKLSIFTLNYDMSIDFYLYELMFEKNVS